MQFQKDVLPEITSQYVLGNLNNPFYQLFVQKLPLTSINSFSADPLTAATETVGEIWYTSANLLKIVSTTSVVNSATFTTSF